MEEGGRGRGLGVRRERGGRLHCATSENLFNATD